MKEEMKAGAVKRLKAKRSTGEMKSDVGRRGKKDWKSQEAAKETDSL